MTTPNDDKSMPGWPFHGTKPQSPVSPSIELPHTLQAYDVSWEALDREINGPEIGPFPLETMKAVWEEAERNRHRRFPAHDFVRAAGLLCEEAGETIAAALDLTRRPPSSGTFSVPAPSRLSLLTKLRQEATEAASMAVQTMIAAQAAIDREVELAKERANAQR